MTTDLELLSRFARTNAEDAFAELVRRHLNLVYSVALRRVNGDEHFARDVAQNVFTDLARKAGSLAQHEVLTGWLYTSAHFAAVKIVRTENRRRDREEKFMREPTPEAAPDTDWEKIRPTLEDAMHELKESDRAAILLRFFENRPFAEVGAQLGLNEESARKRVERAVEKLRTIFTRRGISTATAFASVISAHAIQIAPAGLAAALTTTTLTTAGTGTFTLLKLMTATPIKLALSTLVVASAATALVVQHQTQAQLRAENSQLQQQVTQLQTDSADFSNRLAAAAGAAPKLPSDQYNELLKLRGEVGLLRGQSAELDQTRQAAEAANQKLQTVEQKLADATSATAKFTAHQVAVVNATKELGLAIRIYSGDHNNEFPTNIDQMTNELAGSPKKMMDILWDVDFVNIGNLSYDHPQMVELRERMPRQAPDGTWSRIYGFADGSVQIATSNDGNFDAWEKANTEAPPPQGQ